jgi:hypothetical protein
MRDTRLDILDTTRLEAMSRIQRLHVTLRMQGQRLAAMPGNNVLEQTVCETLATAVSAGDHAADETAGIPIARLRGVVNDDPQVRSRTERIGYPHVLSSLVTITVVELRFVDTLFKKKHFGAQPGYLEKLVEGQLAPRALKRKRIDHDYQRNRGESLRYWRLGPTTPQ